MKPWKLQKLISLTSAEILFIIDEWRFLNPFSCFFFCSFIFQNLFLGFLIEKYPKYIVWRIYFVELERFIVKHELNFFLIRSFSHCESKQSLSNTHLMLPSCWSPDTNNFTWSKHFHSVNIHSSAHILYIVYSLGSVSSIWSFNFQTISSTYNLYKCSFGYCKSKKKKYQSIVCVCVCFLFTWHRLKQTSVLKSTNEKNCKLSES